RRAMYASLGGAGSVVFRISVGARSVTARITYPQVNEYFDLALIGVLRTAYELYKRDDLLSDLINHFRRQATAAPTPADAIYPRLALSAIMWWTDDRDEAIAELTKVVNAGRPESDLRLDLADVLMQESQPAEAIELLDSVQPLDNMSLRRR